MASKKAHQTTDQGQVKFNPNAYRLHKQNVPGFNTGVGKRQKSTKNDTR